MAKKPPVPCKSVKLGREDLGVPRPAVNRPPGQALRTRRALCQGKARGSNKPAILHAAQSLRTHLKGLKTSGLGLLGLIFWVHLTAQPLQINELCADNISRWPINEFSGLSGIDSRDLHDDWVEIHNPGSAPAQMAGLYLTDDPQQPTKWQISSEAEIETQVPPGGYLLLWLDGQPQQGPLHASFKLNRAGEFLALFQSDGQTLVDSVRFGILPGDVSYGRPPGEAGGWAYCFPPTPGLANSQETSYQGLSPAPVPSLPGGFYSKPLKLRFELSPAAQLYYTLDGTPPTPDNGTRYQNALLLDHTQTVRAILQEKGKAPSETITHTYFFPDAPATLPTVALHTDPAHFIAPGYGFNIQPMREDVQVPAHVQFFDSDGTLVLTQSIGLKLFGGICRRYPKQSFTLLTRPEFGPKDFQYPFFPDKKLDHFDGLVLRADPTPGRWDEKKLVGERIKNELIYRINQEMGNRVDMPAYRPVSLYINGNYWGIYTLMERKGKQYVRSNFGVKKADIIDEASMIVVSGSPDHFVEMKEFMNEEDIAAPAVWDSVENMLDLSNYLDYIILQIYAGANDFDDNTRYWRPREPEGKWRFICYDMDSWGKPTDNTLRKFSRWNEAFDVDLLGRLVENPGFRDRFVNRFCDFLNSALRPDNIHRYVDEITAPIADEMQRDRGRWSMLMDYGPPGWQATWMKAYATTRHQALLDHLENRFELDLPQDLTLKVEPSDGGQIRVNSLQPDNYPWQGQYFSAVPIQLEAQPAPGYVFAGWTGIKADKLPLLRLTVTEAKEITAKFRKQKP